MKKETKNGLLLAALGTAGALAGWRAAARWQRRYAVKGKAILITGGSRGLGLVMARQLTEQEAQVAICARDAAELERARASIATHGAEPFAVPCDVTEQVQVREMIDGVRRRFGRIDVLINNAAIIQVGPMDAMTIDDYERALRTNFWGPLYAILAVLPEMRARRDGRIVNISSLGGKISIPHLLPYSVSKHALAGLSEGMRAELVRENVIVTTVSPGLMRTGSAINVTYKGQHRAEQTWFSISDSLPLLSISAERAASRIIAGFKRGDAEVVLPAETKLGLHFRALFPELSADLLAVAARLLPEYGGIGRQGAKGTDSKSDLSPSLLTALGDQAARRNNEL